MKRATIRHEACLLAMTLMGACAHFTPTEARTVGTSREGKSVTAGQLQQEVQRFTGNFTSSIGQAAESMVTAQHGAHRLELLRRLLLYYSSALDIATGPNPVVNMLDMVVFVSLSRSAFDEYWLPQVFGKPGVPLAEALRKSSDEIWQVADNVLAPSQQRELHELIEDWRREHPGRTRVEAVRLAAFSETAANTASAKRARGLLASVSSATQAANQAVLLGERAMFLAQRAPFLMRLQARIAAQEMMSDTLDRASQIEPALDKAQGLEPILRDVSQLTAQAQAAAAESRQLVEAIQPVLASLEPLLTERATAQGKTTALEHTLDSANHVTEQALPLVRELHALADTVDRNSREVTREADRLARRWLLYVFLVGAGWMLLFGAGYYAFKRAMARHSAARSEPPGSARADPQQ